MKSRLASVGCYDRKWVLKFVARDLVNPISGVWWKCLDNQLSGRYQIAEQSSFTEISQRKLGISAVQMVLNVSNMLVHIDGIRNVEHELKYSEFKFLKQHCVFIYYDLIGKCTEVICKCLLFMFAFIHPNSKTRNSSKKVMIYIYMGNAIFLRVQ